MKIILTEGQLTKIIKIINENSVEPTDMFDEWISRSKTNNCPKYLTSDKQQVLFWDFDEYTNGFDYSMFNNWNDKGLVDSILKITTPSEYDLMDEAIGCRRFQIAYKKKEQPKMKITKVGYIEDMIKQFLTGISGLGQNQDKEKIKQHLVKLGKKINI
jgi:hypothetical protein